MIVIKLKTYKTPPAVQLTHYCISDLNPRDDISRLMIKKKLFCSRMFSFTLSTFSENTCMLLLFENFIHHRLLWHIVFPVVVVFAVVVGLFPCFRFQIYRPAIGQLRGSHHVAPPMSQSSSQLGEKHVYFHCWEDTVQGEFWTNSNRQRSKNMLPTVTSNTAS